MSGMPEKEYSVWSAGAIGSLNSKHRNERIEKLSMRFSRLQNWLALEIARQCVSAVNVAESLGPFTEEDVQREYIHRKAFYDGQGEFIAKKTMDILAGGPSDHVPGDGPWNQAIQK